MVLMNSGYVFSSLLRAWYIQKVRNLLIQGYSLPPNGYHPSSSPLVVGNFVLVCGSDRDWGAPSPTTSGGVGGWSHAGMCYVGLQFPAASEISVNCTCMTDVVWQLWRLCL